MFIYQVQGFKKSAEIFETKEKLLANYKQTGTHESHRTRKELQGQPKLSGLLGPMYNGTRGDKVVIRYETQAEYNTYAD